jgi:hypothetical protein
VKIQIRFNTERLKETGKSLPEWRVLEDGKERLARRIEIRVPAWTTEDEIAPGVIKWHITCEGRTNWDDRKQECVIS